MLNEVNKPARNPKLNRKKHKFIVTVVYLWVKWLWNILQALQTLEERCKKEFIKILFYYYRKIFKLFRSRSDCFHFDWSIYSGLYEPSLLTHICDYSYIFWSQISNYMVFLENCIQYKTSIETYHTYTIHLTLVCTNTKIQNSRSI